MKNNSYIPWKILIVDDDEDTHDVTIMALKRLKFNNRPLEFIQAFTAEQARKKMEANDDIAIILLDVVMETDTAGLDLVKIIREDMGNSNIRIIIRTGNPGLAPEETITLNYDINDYRGKTELTALSLRSVIITALRSYNDITTIGNLVKEIDDMQKELIYSLGEIAESRSIDNGKHVKRVGYISALLCEKLGYSQKEIEMIQLSASMHDIGKLAVDDKILNKPCKLTSTEFEEVKKHTIYGYEILKKSEREILKQAALISYEHHENFDGSGYPRGLKGKEINIYGRIVAIVDVFDALATKRAYKEVWAQKDIIDFLKKQRGIKFDPEILDIFFENIEEINEVLNKIQKNAI